MSVNLWKCLGYWLLVIYLVMVDISDRDMDLLNAYKEVLSEIKCPFLLQDVMEKTVRKPAKRFYSSTKYAYMCIKAIKEGRPIQYQQDEKKRMIHEVWERVQRLESEYPDMKLDHLVEMIMDSPAPEFYLKASSAEVILCRAKQKERAKELRKIKNRYERIQKRSVY